MYLCHRAVTLCKHPFDTLSQGNKANNKNSTDGRFATFLTCRNQLLLCSGLIAEEIQNSPRNSELCYITESPKLSIYTEFIIMESEHLLYLK